MRAARRQRNSPTLCGALDTATVLREFLESLHEMLMIHDFMIQKGAIKRFCFKPIRLHDFSGIALLNRFRNGFIRFGGKFRLTDGCVPVGIREQRLTGRLVCDKKSELMAGNPLTIILAPVYICKRSHKNVEFWTSAEGTGSIIGAEGAIIRPIINLCLWKKYLVSKAGRNAAVRATGFRGSATLNR
jgi:hypothetical protein